jgi:nicotinamide-nucleotide amidase
VVRLLRKRGETVAVAECATDGLLDHWLADSDAETSTLLGGVVLHETDSLSALLGITNTDPASPAAAEAMARAIREKTGADYGLAIAALPQNAIYSADEELQGTLQMALASGENVRVKGVPLSGHPAIVRSRAAKQALNLLRLALLND